MNNFHITLIGYGEVGQILAEDFGQRENLIISAWDKKFSDHESSPSQHIKTSQAMQKDDAATGCLDADLVISAVTASETFNAAQSVLQGMKPGSFFLDLNSASPGQKQKAADAIENAGGKYVEGAVMSPIAPKRLACPILLGGPHADDFSAIAKQVGLAGCRVFSDQLGKASAAKMCRSVIVKGMESLLTESLLAARHYGVEDTVVGSLDDLFPGPDWQKLAPYMISRSLEHGGRRAEEMREVARTVIEAGEVALMSSACAERQDIAKAFADFSEPENLNDMLDNIIEKTKAGRN